MLFKHYPAKLIYVNFHPLEVVSRYRDQHLQVADNDHICLIFDFVIWKQSFNYIIYSTDENIYNTDKKCCKVKTHNIEMVPAPKPETKKLHIYIY